MKKAIKQAGDKIAEKSGDLIMRRLRGVKQKTSKRSRKY